MAFNKDKEFKYSFRGINRIVEEKNNSFIRFAQIAWVGEDEEVEPDKIKYDLRRYTTDADGNEKMLKGVSFLTNDGPTELTHILLEEGFGKTETVLSTIKERDDFKEAVESIASNNVSKKSGKDDDTFDLRDLI